MKQDFELIEHTADLQIRVYGRSKEELFTNALCSMFQVIEPHTDQTGCRREDNRLVCESLPYQHSIEVNATDMADLLVDFLSQALYLSDVHNEAYLAVTIHKLTKTAIDATVHGIKVDRFGIEIKAVTYHDLEIKKVDGRWQADIVFDI